MLQPKATLKFPLGEVSLEEKEEEETNKVLSINAIVKGQFLNGLCTAHYVDDDLKLRYSYKVSTMYYSGLLFLSFSLAKDEWLCRVDMQSRRLLPTKIFCFY